MMAVDSLDVLKILTKAWSRPLSPERYKDKAQYLVLHGVRLFHRKGVNGTGLAELLEAAEMGKSQFYHYFANKEEFVCAVLRYEMDFFLTRVARDARRLESLDQFETWFEPYVALGRLPQHLGCPVGVIAAEMSANSELVRRTAAECLQRWIAAMSDGLAELQRQQPLRSDFDPSAFAEWLAGSIQGALLLGRTMLTDRYVISVRDQALQLLQGYRISASASVT